MLHSDAIQSLNQSSPCTQDICFAGRSAKGRGEKRKCNYWTNSNNSIFSKWWSALAVASKFPDVKSASTAAENEIVKSSKKSENFGRSSPSSQSRVSTLLSDNLESEESVNTELLRTYSAMKQAALREMESEWMKQASDLARGLRDRELSSYRYEMLYV